MARAGGSGRGGSPGGGGGRSFGGRAGDAGGGSFRRGGVSGGGLGAPGGAPRPSGPRPGSAGGPRPGGAGGFGGPGFGGPGMYPGGGYGPRPGGPPPPPPPVYGPGMYNNYGGFGRRRRRGVYPGYYGGGGCFTLVVMALAAVLLGVLLLGAAAPTEQAKTARKRLPESAVNQTAYYTDDLGWISDSSLLLPGMEHFYQKTGVQPYLYLTPDINGSESPTGAEAQQYANQLYNELFTDEGHYLLIFAENPTGYYTWYLAGEQAATVMDSGANDILLDYIDGYYYNGSLSDEQMFSQAFEKTADKIMRFSLPWWGIVLIVAAIAVIVVAVLFSRRDRQQRQAAQLSGSQWRDE